MAFDLPRSPRTLRFTGSVRALAVADGGVAPEPRRALPSLGDDDIDTALLDREALAHADTTPRQAKLPVPGFRSKNEVLFHHVEPVLPARKPPSLLDNLPLGVWLLAAIVAGVASFYVAPQARDGVRLAVEHLDTR